MKLRREQCIALLIASAQAMCVVTVHAADAPKRAEARVQPDAKFLEYLGTLEGDTENWTDVSNDAARDALIAASDAAKVSPPAKKTEAATQVTGSK